MALILALLAAIASCWRAGIALWSIWSEWGSVTFSCTTPTFVILLPDIVTFTWTSPYRKLMSLTVAVRTPAEVLVVFEEIGRASCRERVWVSGGGAAC